MSIEDKVENLEIARLTKPMSNILRQMWPHIRNQEYGCLIGDDYSGRLPTFILSRVIKEVNRLNDWPPVSTVFFKGRQIFCEITDQEKRELQRKVLQEVQQGKRALFVTDYILSASTARNTTNILTEVCIPVDIAVVSIGHPDWPVRHKDFRSGIKVFDGGLIGVPDIYKRYDLAGVGPLEVQIDTEKARRAENDANVVADLLINCCQLNLYSNIPTWRRRSL